MKAIIIEKYKNGYTTKEVEVYKYAMSDKNNALYLYADNHHKVCGIMSKKHIYGIVNSDTLLKDDGDSKYGLYYIAIPDDDDIIKVDASWYEFNTYTNEVEFYVVDTKNNFRRLVGIFNMDNIIGFQKID